MFITPRSFAPFVSVKVKVNIPALPVSRAGFIPATAVVVVCAAPGTFQTPIRCQPELFSMLSRAARYTILVPANDAGNVMLRVKFIVLPLPDADDPAPLIVHWLLPSDPVPFNGIDPAYPLPALLTRYNVLPGRL